MDSLSILKTIERLGLIRKGINPTQYGGLHFVDIWDWENRKPGEKIEHCYDPTGRDKVYWGDLRRSDDRPDPTATLWIDLQYCRGSDYSGGPVELANYRYMVAEYGNRDWLVCLYGDWGSFGILVPAWAILLDVSLLQSRVEGWCREKYDRYRYDIGDWREYLREHPDITLADLTPHDLDLIAELQDALMQLQQYPLLDDQLLSDIELDILEEAVGDYLTKDLIRQIETEQGLDIEITDRGMIERYVIDLIWQTNTYPEYESPFSCYVDLYRLAKHVDLKDWKPFAVVTIADQ